MNISREIFRHLLVFILLGFNGCEKETPSRKMRALEVYCAAGLRKPMETIAEAYAREYGTEIQFQFGGSGTLLSQIRASQRGDLYLAADDESIANARKTQSIREVLPFALQTPVIAVKAGNPKSVAMFSDLLRRDLKVAVANPETASIGKSTRAAAGTAWDALAKSVAVMKPTVSEIAADLTLGSVDAAIVWDALTKQFSGIIGIHVSELDEHQERSSAAVLSVSQQPEEALKFARFIAAPGKGASILAEAGFEPLPGDAWSPKPELVLYSGAVNRLAVESLLGKFATREGVSLTTVFNGCGVLCATMKTMGGKDAAKYPDAYYACDLCFVPPVAEQFPEAVVLTETAIGIAVRAGNPRGIKSLADLAGDKLRVGLCNSEQSTLGYMTRGILKSSGLLESVQKNVVVEVPTADFLVNQMRAGALDAIVVYSVNVQGGQETLEFVPLLHPGAKAVQPFAVWKDSANKQLAYRLLEFLKANRSAFENAGFQWRGNEPAVKSKSIEVPLWLREK